MGVAISSLLELPDAMPKKLCRDHRSRRCGAGAGLGSNESPVVHVHLTVPLFTSLTPGPLWKSIVCYQ